MSDTKLTGEERTIDDLQCVVVDSQGCEERVDCLAIICHGFGASGRDLVGLAFEIEQILGDMQNVRMVFPAAPIQLDPTGMYDARAWWPIDMEKLQTLMEAGDIRDLRNERPELLPTRRQQLLELVTTLSNEAGVSLSQVVLGGFSQGSMLVTDLALALDKNVGGLVVWSGTLLNETEWLENAKQHDGLRVVQSHGKSDPILPFIGAELLRDMLNAHGADLQFIPFAGEHAIPPESISAAAKLIAEVAKLDKS